MTLGRGARQTLVFTGVALIAFVAAQFFPIDRTLLVEILLLALGAIALHALVRAATPSEPRQSGASMRALVSTRRAPGVPEPLVSLDNKLVLAEATAADFHLRIRPLLRDAAASRLRAFRRIDPERDPERARELLGDELWELVRPDAPAPRDPRVRGIAVAEIDAALDAIDRIRP